MTHQLKQFAKMISTQQLKFLLLPTFFLLLNQAIAIPLNNGIVHSASNGTFNELRDLNLSTEDSKIATILEHLKQSSKESAFAHHDDNTPETAANIEQSPKYDVEVLELRDSMKRENIEIEEQFKGPALKVDTDTFMAENIEMNDVTVREAIPQNHFTLTLCLLILALGSICLYVTLVLWRSHLERRYGMRELLVNNDDDVYHTTTTPLGPSY